MSQEIETPVSDDVPFHAELENSSRLPGILESAKAADPEKISDENVQPYDFGNPACLLPRHLKCLKRHEEAFAVKMASQYSDQLRLECSLKLASVEVLPGRSLAAARTTNGHLALFKIEPLRGVALVQFTPRLGTGMIDRLLGGQGAGSREIRALSDVEVVLFEQISQLFATEWCAHWAFVAALKPILLGYESNSRFRQIAAPQVQMLAICFEMSAGACSGQIELNLPFRSLESLIKKLSAGSIHRTATASAIRPNSQPVSEWNQSFDQVPVSLIAEWPATELSARDVLALKVGDVLRMGSESAQAVQVRLADQLKFQGRPGTLAGQWAVELTRLIV